MKLFSLFSFSRIRETIKQTPYIPSYRYLEQLYTRVLHIGSTNEIFLAECTLLESIGVRPADVGILKNGAEKREIKSYSAIEQIPPQLFDYVLISETEEQVARFSSTLITLRLFCHSRTRVILECNAGYSNFFKWLWQLICRKAPKGLYCHYTSVNDFKKILQLHHYEVIGIQQSLIIPYYLPGISWLLNSLIPLIPLISSLCLKRFIIARPLLPQKKHFSVSVIIPCRNEEGNIEQAIKTLPQLGAHTEIIFVEGNSRDKTLDEIKRVITQFNKKDIKYFIQTGTGKADAVRLGCEKATGDILMILDGDLTVEPQELVNFYSVLAEGKAEFANGSRLVYPMEKDAMPFLNIFANYSFGLLVSWIIGQRVKDTLCGTKVFYKKDYELMSKNRSIFEDPFGDFDLLFGASFLSLKIIDVPVHYKSRKYGSSQIGGYFFNGLLLLKVCWNGFKNFKLKLSR